MFLTELRIWRKSYLRGHLLLDIQFRPDFYQICYFKIILVTFEHVSVEEDSSFVKSEVCVFFAL